jgi:hypothetical protein
VQASLYSRSLLQPFDAEAVSISACCSRERGPVCSLSFFLRELPSRSCWSVFQPYEDGWMCLQGGRCNPVVRSPTRYTSWPIGITLENPQIRMNQGSRVDCHLCKLMHKEMPLNLAAFGEMAAKRPLFAPNVFVPRRAVCRPGRHTSKAHGSANACKSMYHDMNRVTMGVRNCRKVRQADRAVGR